MQVADMIDNIPLRLGCSRNDVVDGDNILLGRICRLQWQNVLTVYFTAEDYVRAWMQHSRMASQY